MRRLTNPQYLDRLGRRRPEFTPLEPYCKAWLPIPVLCANCGNVIVREAHQHIRFGCPICRDRARTTSRDEEEA